MIIIVHIVFVAMISVVYAQNSDEELQKINDKIEKKTKQYESATKALADIRNKKDSILQKITGLASQLNVTQSQISDLENDINETEMQLAVINDNLNSRKDSLAEKVNLRNQIIRDYSKRSMSSDLEIFFGGVSTANNNLNGFEYSALTQIFSKSLGNETTKLIGLLDSEIQQFEKDKEEAQSLKTDLEESQNKLLALKNQLEGQKNNAQSEKKNLETQENTLEDKAASLQKEISELTAKQQQILNEKSGTGSSSVGDYESPEAALPNPKFSPAFAAMSYGAFTHGNGMSQYGAKGRAVAGQDYKAILKFYYKVDIKKDDNFAAKISVSGYGTMDFQKYLYGIAEMPSDWPLDALKAQAIAARTYANRSSKPICTTESCQVFLKSKSDNPPAKWKQAVDETKGIILNNPTTSQYSSTTGGYVNNVGWDKSGSWPGEAYEKKAGSPWFYKAWYTKSYSTSSDKCGRSDPWLKESEMVDILNSWVVWDKGNSNDRNHISPITTNCWGGDPYSTDDMADRADDLSGKFTSVSGVDVDVSSNGYTSKVTFNTNRGTVSIDGSQFKTVFNLRAPGYISLKNKIYDFVRK